MIKSKVALVFGIILIIASLLTGYASLSDLIKGPLSDSFIGSARGALGVLIEPPPSWYFYSLAVAYVIISLVAFVSGIGLLMLKKWSRNLCFFLSGIGIGVAVINLISLTILNLYFQFINSLFGFFITILFYSLLIYSLTRKNIKKLFT